MVAILDYDAGNLTSVRLAVEHLGHRCTVTRDPGAIDAAERVIFPGQGAAGSAMANLERLGLAVPLRRALGDGRPVLGICIAHQLVFDHSEEDGGTACLGLLPGRVVPFEFPVERRRAEGLKVPQMGWNQVHPTGPHAVLDGFEPGRHCYFVHGYYPRPEDRALVLAETEYGGVRYASMCARGNLVTMQFHPEKSGRAGLGLLAAFLAWDGRFEPHAAGQA